MFYIILILILYALYYSIYYIFILFLYQFIIKSKKIEIINIFVKRRNQ